MTQQFISDIASPNQQLSEQVKHNKEQSAMVEHWLSPLEYLPFELPSDKSTKADGSSVNVNVPLSLVKQSIHKCTKWKIPLEIQEHYRRFRPTSLWCAETFAKSMGLQSKIYVKYEGGNASGSHKLNTALAQAYYYKKAGVTELVTGTGAGQWGTAMAVACTAFGLKSRVFMVESSLNRKPYRGSLMRTFGATVHSSPSEITEVGRTATNAQNGLALAIGEAAEYAQKHEGTSFCIGSGETYSIIHQSVIGQEAIKQMDALGVVPDVLIGALGAGSNLGGLIIPFYIQSQENQISMPQCVAAESTSCPKFSKGVYAYDHTDSSGLAPMEAMYTLGSGFPIPDQHAGGLRYHGAAKLLSAMRHHNMIDPIAVPQEEVFSTAHSFAHTEGIVPAPESGHALAAAIRLAKEADARDKPRNILLCLSGHGYFDLSSYDDYLAGKINDAGFDESAFQQSTHELQKVSEPT